MIDNTAMCVLRYDNERGKGDHRHAGGSESVYAFTEVRSLTQTLADVAHAMKVGRGGREARIAFSTPELLWQVLTAKRWELLKALCGAGVMSIREAARRVNRDVQAVHGDVSALLDAGVLSPATLTMRPASRVFT